MVISITFLSQVLNNLCSLTTKYVSFILTLTFRYTLKAQGQGAGAFNIGPSSGIVKLAKELDFEDLRQPHIYQLLVTATEDSGGFSTSVEVRPHSVIILPCYLYNFYLVIFIISNLNIEIFFIWILYPFCYKMVGRKQMNEAQKYLNMIFKFWSFFLPVDNPCFRRERQCTQVWTAR